MVFILDGLVHAAIFSMKTWSIFLYLSNRYDARVSNKLTPVALGALFLFGMVFGATPAALAQESCSDVFSDQDLSYEIEISNKSSVPPLARSYSEAYKIAEKFDVFLTEEFLTLSKSDQFKYLNEVHLEMAKIPPMVLAIISQAGFRLELVLDAVTHHPKLRHLSGVTPRGGTRPWDKIPGGSASPSLKCSVIAANSLKRGHGSKNLILHEHAHTFDLALSYLVKNRGVLKAQEPILFSKIDADFQALWKTTDWKDAYRKSYVEEAFAESFAFYFDSVTSREELRQSYPKVYEYFRQRFGSPVLR